MLINLGAGLDNEERLSGSYGYGLSSDLSP